MENGKGSFPSLALSGREKSIFRKALLRERTNQVRLIESLRRGGLGDAETGAIGELSSYDQHPADQGTETFERERDVGLREGAEETLDRIDRALLRLKDGSYGICASCGEAIDKERLLALPYALECIDCAEDAEVSDRPAEEALLAPAFGRTFTDGTENVAYDGEDAWQDVAKYGTANSPQDVPGAKDFEDAYVDGDEAQGVVTELDAVTGGEIEAGDDDLPDLSVEKKRTGRQRGR